MRPLNSSLAAFASLAMMAGPGLMVASNAMGMPPETPRPSRKRAQTQTVSATVDHVWANEHVNTRQVRRQRERLAVKSRTDYPPGPLAYRGDTSRYMPHIGAKERGRYAADSQVQSERETGK